MIDFCGEIYCFGMVFDMKLGIGIDTGGTYTDAVIYRFADRQVLSSAKSLTTKYDLSVGIIGALEKLDRQLLAEAEIAALSTTLATNACVEGKGSRAALLFLGLDEETLRRVGGSYGLSAADEIHACACGGSYDGTILPDPDWDSVLSEAADWVKTVDGIGIVERYAMNNGAVAELAAREKLTALRDLPTVCSSELFSGLNSVQRGSGTLLNAKLVPILRDFMDAIRRAFERLGITAPIVVVRSDGSLMSEEFARRVPVETILCGPAASVLGGVELANREDCVIVDMGGTTTDVSLVKAGRPVRVQDGIHIGAWKTFVRGVQIDTFGLGGDSAIRFDGQDFALSPERVIPISLLGRDYPFVKEQLRELLNSKATHTRPIHEYYVLVRDITDAPGYTDEERRFCAALKNGPLSLRDGAAALGTDLYHMDVSRLEHEGIVLRSGLTPTDFMHIAGDFDSYDTETAELAARFLLRNLHRKPFREGELEKLCEEVYNRVRKTLYCRLVGILLKNRYPSLRETGLGPQLEALVENRWEAYLRGEPFPGYFGAEFRTSAALVGIGAPIHIFLPAVADALGTECIIPENAGVANAIGAVVGNITASVEAEVRPNHTADGIHGFFVCAPGIREYYEKRPAAEARAEAVARELAEEEARKRGASGEIRVLVESRDTASADSRGTRIDFGTVYTATGIGGASL